MKQRLSRLARAGVALTFLFLAAPQVHASEVTTDVQATERGVIEWVTTQFEGLLSWFQSSDPSPETAIRGEAGSN